MDNRADTAECYTVAEFCASYRIRKTMYYKLKALGLGPAETKILKKVLISKEAAAAWFAERQADSLRVRRGTAPYGQENAAAKDRANQEGSSHLRPPFDRGDDSRKETAPK